MSSSPRAKRRNPVSLKAQLITGLLHGAFDVLGFDLSRKSGEEIIDPLQALGEHSPIEGFLLCPFRIANPASLLCLLPNRSSARWLAA